MRIIELNSIATVISIHEKIFGEKFPYESYTKKLLAHAIYIYGYYIDSDIVGYSIIIDEQQEKNLYAWYGGLLPEYQGQGVTVQFFDIMCEKARELGYKSISLATTNCRPNMLRLAIKYGFDIYDMKKRDYGEGNKIYFKYYIHPKTAIVISLRTNDNKRLNISDLEIQLVMSYKNNCNKIVFKNVLDVEDEKAILYAKRYCSKFLRKIEFELHGNNQLIEGIVQSW